MPKKTIYVKDEDMAIFERAEELGDGDSLSAVIAEALRRYVEAKELEAMGLEFHKFKATGKTVAFYGRLLAEKDTEATSDEGRGENWYIYQSKARKIIIRRVDWTRWQGEKDYTEWVTLNKLPDYDEVVFESGYVGPHYPVPNDVLEEAYASMGEEKQVFIE